MKKIYTLILAVSSLAATAQNTFPTSGNAGIGILNPTEKLDVRGNIYWDGFNSGNPRAVKIGYSGGNYGGIGYNLDFTSSTGVFNRPLNDYSSYLELWNGGFRFFGTNNFGSASNIGLGSGSQDLSLRAIISREGNMGIGTDNPLQKFVVSNNGTDGFEVYVNHPGVIGLQAYNRTAFNYSKMQFDASQFAFNNGNVGIGTTDPKGYKLAVAGNMIAESVKVSLQGTWPDYVFSKDYQLPTLQETEKHIKDKGHLPGIPSAEEVKANGVDLGEMNAKLLQKIEELTLHLIRLEKENEGQSKELKEQKEQIRQLINRK